MEGGGDADEDERPEAWSVMLRRLLGAVRQVLRDWERAVLVVLSEDLEAHRAPTWSEAGQEARARAQVGMAMQDGLATQVSMAAQDRTAPQVGTAA
eukprot:scaffold610_cov64-Phaeocystis_antarctica.AAC.1